MEIDIKKVLSQIIPPLENIGMFALSAPAVEESSIGKDVKISLDSLLQEKLVELLSSAINAEMVLEEGKGNGDFTKNIGLQWIVDPLDGSLNHLRGIPMTSISIALWHGAEPLMGIVYDFGRKEMFAGVVGEGAWINERLISTSGVGSPEKGVLCTGFPSYRDYSDESLKRFIAQVRGWKKVRLFGSAALSLAYVACGRTDAYVEEDIRIWDVAAGLAIVKAAGGDIFFKASNRINFVTAAATNGKIPVRGLVK